MGFIGDIFHVLDQPILNALALLYEYLPGQDFGVAVIVLTLVLRVILYPLTAKAFEAQKAQTKIQDKVKAIHEQYKGQRDEIARRLLELYRKEKINPLASILPLLPQIFVFVSLFTILRASQEEQLSLLYQFVPNPGTIDPSFLGIVNLDERFLPLAIVAGLTQLLQGKQMLPPQGGHVKKDFSQNLQLQMTYAFPLLTVFIGASLPSALSLYWATSNIFSIMQQWYLIKKSTPSDDGVPSRMTGQIPNP